MAEKIRQAKKTSPKKIIKKTLPLFFAACFFIACYFFWKKIENAESLNFQYIKVISNENHISKTELRSVIQENLKGGFFSLDQSGLKNNLLALPWVSNVSFRRIWPRILIINIDQQNAVARWNSKDVLNTQGDVFSPPESSIPKKLPLLISPNAYQKEIFENFILLQKLLSAINLSVVQLEYDSHNAWKMKMSNGIEVTFAQDHVDEQIHQFLVLYPKLIQSKAALIKSVDLRYTNGLAIQWRDPMKKIQNQ